MEHQQQQQHQDMASGSPAELKNDPGWVIDCCAHIDTKDNSMKEKKNFHYCECF